MKTLINTDINKDVVGYMVNTDLSLDNQRAVAEICDRLANEIGPGVWFAPKETLHITLMDWLAPLVDYGEDKDQLFRKIKQDYDKVLMECLEGIGDIEITFDELRVSPSAIFMVGHDVGQFKTIRDNFMSKVELLPVTKVPPSIIHFSIARFSRELDFAFVEDWVKKEKLTIKQVVSNFRLVRENEVPMIGYEAIKSYQL